MLGYATQRCGTTPKEPETGWSWQDLFPPYASLLGSLVHYRVSHTTEPMMAATARRHYGIKYSHFSQYPLLKYSNIWSY